MPATSANPRFAAAKEFLNELLVEWNHGMLDATQMAAQPHFAAAHDAIEENERLHKGMFAETQRADALATALAEEHPIHPNMSSCKTCNAVNRNTVLQAEVVNAVDETLKKLTIELKRVQDAALERGGFDQGVEVDSVKFILESLVAAEQKAALLDRVVGTVDSYIAGRHMHWETEPKRSRREDAEVYARSLESGWFKEHLVKFMERFVKGEV